MTEPAPEVVHENIRTLADRRRQAAAQRSHVDRGTDAVTRFAGSLKFVALHLAFFSGWIVINAGVTPAAPFDPTFVLLGTWASVEAIFLATFVLITQNRMARESDRHAQLDLQISLLTEYELTRALGLLTALAATHHIELHDAKSAELSALVDPGAVLDAIEQDSGD